MLKIRDETLLTEYHQWIRRHIISAGTPVIVTGAKNSGKSTLLQALGRRSVYEGRRFVYWDLAPVSRQLADAAGFWRDFAKTLNTTDLYPPPSEEDATTVVEIAIEDAPGDEPLVLILDHWDLALDDVAERVNDRALDQLLSRLVDRGEHPTPDQRPCTLVATCQFMSILDLVTWSKTRSAPGLYALSKTVERRYTAAPLPFLSVQTAEAIFLENDIPRKQAHKAAARTGGWLPLMQAAVDSYRAGPDGMDQEGRVAFACLQDSAFQALERIKPRAKEEPERIWFTRVVGHLMRCKDPKRAFSEYGIPFTADADRTVRPAETILSICSPAYLFVDLENVWHAEKHSANHLDRSEICEAVKRLASACLVPPERVYVSTRDADRALEILGAGLPAAWNIEHSRLPQHKRRQKNEVGEKDNSDDTVLAAKFAHIAGREPFAVMHILSGDNDFWAALSNLCVSPQRAIQVLPQKGTNSFLRESREMGWDIDDSTYEAIRSGIIERRSGSK